MKRILINGNFFCRNLTGIERFAWETCRCLDFLITNEMDVSILVPANATKIPEYTNIHIIVSPHAVHEFPRWDLFVFKHACKKYDAIGLNFSNTAPFGKWCGLAFIHDIYAVDCPKDFSSLKDFLVRAYSLLNYKNIVRHAKKVFTVSDFSKKRIQQKYRISDDRIEVIPNGWDHFLNVTEDASIFERYPQLLTTPYFFTLGSLSKRKNLAWIARYAQNHPEELFAVSGKAISGLVAPELAILQSLPNVILVGYVSDAQVKALMKSARAFVFPSYYEGFGIPPLEALSVGTPIIVSNAACLPEIYGRCAHYIDIDSTNVSLEELLAEPVESPEVVLQRYTYKNAAEKLMNCLSAFTNDNVQRSI